MGRYLIYIITSSFLVVFAPPAVKSQSLEGRWEGIMGDEILQVNIVQKGKMLCGYTYDFIIENPANSCKAYFTGSYDAGEGYWRLKGYRFIVNSGSHVLMSISLRYNKVKGKPVLQGYVLPKSSPSNTMLSNDMVFVELKKEYISKSELSSLYKICFPQEEAPGKPAEKPVKKNPPSSPEKQSPPNTPPPVTEKPEVAKREPKDSIEKSVLKKEAELPSVVSSRKRNEVSRIPVNTRSITLKVFDNGIVDDDTVTIYYNKRLLISKRKLSDKPIEINLELDEKEPLHEIVMFAENLGSIPPNTALIVVTAGDKRYELYSSASMEENAILVFEYKPKEK